uniref:Uncharacterized protein n=2 Tax=Anguilla anguilla TaxID=7936 RepID=A0A0E9QLA9_ANGAN
MIFSERECLLYHSYHSNAQYQFQMQFVLRVSKRWKVTAADR